MAVITHQLRFPSIYREDKDFTPRIVHVAESSLLPTFTDSDIRAARAYQKKHRSTQKKALTQGTLKEGRHNTIYFSVLSGELSPSEARELNASLESPLEEHEVEHAITMATKLRTEKLAESFPEAPAEAPARLPLERLFDYRGIKKTSVLGAAPFVNSNGTAMVYTE